MRTAASGVCLLLLAVPARAESEIAFTDRYDENGDAVVEFIGAASGTYACTARDASNTPIAHATAQADEGRVVFANLDVRRIATLGCLRKT